MLMYGQYKTNYANFPISVTSTGMVITGSGTSAVLTYVATPAAGILSVKSLSSATQVFVSTKTAGQLNTKSLSSAGLHYVATPVSAQLAVQNVYNLNTASFTGGYRIAGTASAVSTNITAGLYRVSAVGNIFYLKLGAAATLTTPTFVMPEATTEAIYIASTKLSSITASTAGVLTLIKLA
jgi:hypothetical protein